MSQQHPSFPSHLPRGVAASALTLPRAAPTTTMLRTGVSPTIQIPSVPPAPSVSTVSGSVTGLPPTLMRGPIISGMRTGIQPATTAAQGSVSLADHQRTSLIVQGPPGAGGSIQGQPLQITLTQRVNNPAIGMSLNPTAPTISMSEAMKLAPLGAGKPVQVAQAAGLALPTQKVSLSAHPSGAATSVTPGGGMGLMPVQHQHVLVAASKAGALQVSACVPGISPMSAPMSAATVMTPTTQIPIAKVNPQRQQTLTQGLTVQMVTTTAGAPQDMTQVAGLTTITSQAQTAASAAAAGQLLQLTQPTQRSGPSIIATCTPSSSSSSALSSSSSIGVGMSSSVPAGAGTASVIAQTGERLTGPTVLNLAAANQGQGQEAWVSQFIYSQGRTQLVPSNPTQATLTRPPTNAPVTNTFFLPRPGAEPNKVNNPTPTLTASLTQHHGAMPTSHPPTVLFNAHNMVVEGLRPSQQPLQVANTAIAATIAAMAPSSVTVTTTDSKPAVALSVSSTSQPGLHQSIMVAGSGVRTSDAPHFVSAATGPGQSSTTLIPGSGGATMQAAAAILSAGVGGGNTNHPSHHHLHHHHHHPQQQQQQQQQHHLHHPQQQHHHPHHPTHPPTLAPSSSSHLSSRATVASSLLTMVSTHQSHQLGLASASSPASAVLASSVQQGTASASNSLASLGGGGGGGSSSSNTGASPRPSILRKRNIDGGMVTPKKPNFSMLTESHSPRPEPQLPCGISSPKTPATENSQSSTDTALSSNDGGTPTQNGDRIKTELPDNLDTGAAAGSSPAVPASGSEASPRKRSRKQLFNVSRKMQEDKANTSTEEEEDEPEEDSKPPPPALHIKQEDQFQDRDEFIDEDGIRWTKERTKPTMSLMSEHPYDYKPRFNHFQRYADVKAKDDRNPTLNELIGQRGIMQKATGWKLYYVSAQVEEVMENEESLEQRLEKLRERLDAEASARPSNQQDFHSLLELARGNLQRCKVVRQQLQEAKVNMLNLLKHEPKIRDIITKNLAKRTIKKKERC